MVQGLAHGGFDRESSMASDGMGWEVKAFSEDSLSSVDNVRVNSLFATLVVLRRLLRICVLG